MPLSKEKQRDWMREYRKRSVIPKSSGTAPPVIPNVYLAGHLKHCPDYDVNHPGNHWDNCAYINPLLRGVIPK